MTAGPEHRFQSWTDRLLDRVVLPPMWTTAIDHAHQTTDNARARARGRGIKSGIPDVYVCQGDPTRSAWIELKRGKNGTSAAQDDVHAALSACGIPVFVAYDLAEVLTALRVAGFRLHPNAENICTELTARLDASDRGAKAAGRTKSYVPAKPRTKKPTTAALARTAALRSRVMF